MASATFSLKMPWRRRENPIWAEANENTASKERRDAAARPMRIVRSRQVSIRHEKKERQGLLKGGVPPLGITALEFPVRCFFIADAILPPTACGS